MSKYALIRAFDDPTFKTELAAFCTQQGEYAAAQSVTAMLKQPADIEESLRWAAKTQAMSQFVAELEAHVKA